MTKQTKSVCLLFRTLVLTLLSMLMLGACTQHKSGELSEEVLKALKDADDSVNILSPNALKLIENRMSEAADSNEYYSYELLRVKYHLLEGNGGSMAASINNVERYARGAEPSIRQRHILAMALNAKAAILHNLHQEPKEQLALYTEAYRLLLHKGDTIDLVTDVCANIADTYIQMNDMAQAANWYRRALFLVDSLRLPGNRDVMLQMGLGRVYVNLDDFEMARECYEAVEKEEKTLTPGMMAYFLTNYGNFFYYRKDYENSLKQFLRLESLLGKLGIKDGYEYSLCKVNLADVYLNMDSLKLSEENIVVPEKFFSAVNDEVGLYYVNTIRIGQAVKGGHPERVPQILAGERLSMEPEMGIKDIRERYLMDYYTARGDYRTAYEMVIKSESKEDSLKKSQHIMHTADIMTRFTEDTLRLHHRIAMNEKDAKMERQTLFFVLILVIALLAVLLWMFHARNQKAKMQRRLLDMRLSVLRNRISPHFTFNVLNNEMATVPDDRQQQLSALAKLIRENLDLSLCDLISLKQELDFIGTYLGIVEQSVGKIDYRLVTDASLDIETTMIPPMLIQILVENAVKHGFKGLDAPHLLSIELKKDRQSIETTVTNNGNAFDIRSEATGNGLKIIRTVVNLLNQQRGHSATFSIENKAGETVAKLRLPLMKSET